METTKSASSKTWIKFLIPSVLGILFFLTPFTVDGKNTILLGVLTDFGKDFLAPILSEVIFSIVIISSVLTLYIKLAAPLWVKEGELIDRLFNAGWGWTAIRTFAAISAFSWYFQVGPELIWGENTGNVVFNDLGKVILVVFLFSGILLPFLTDYGLMELIGTLIRKPFRVIFNLPGRSAVDATASWLVAASVGVIITAEQYKKGYYSAREAAVIATNFSVVSLPFAFVMTTFIHLENKFFEIYGIMVLVGLIQALIIPRLPPLSRFKDNFYNNTPAKRTENPQGNYVNSAFSNALTRAKDAPPLSTSIKSGMMITFEIWFAVLPATMGIAEVVMVLVEHTNLPLYLGAPLAPLLEVLGIPNANLAASAMMVSFGDQFLPVIMGANIESELTRFVILVLAVNQLIFMSEVGSYL